MRTTILYIAMSLDGFIADSRGGVDWLEGDGNAADGPAIYDALIDAIDTIVMGRATFDQIVTELSPERWPYGDLLTYVITHRPLPEQANIRFTTETPAALLKRLRSTSGKAIWICGGAAIAQELLACDLIDRLQLTLIPILLGSGIRLFDQSDHAKPLRLVAVKEAGGMVELTYERRTDSPSLQKAQSPV